MKRLHREISGLSVGEVHCEVPSKSRRCSNDSFGRHRNENACNIRRFAVLKKSILQHKCVPVTMGGRRCCPERLMDLASKVCAETLPFQHVEEQCSRVPAPVMQKFIFWSFPRQESDIRRYSALTYDSTAYSASNTSPMTPSQSAQRQVPDITSSQPPNSNHRNSELENRIGENSLTSFSNFGVVTSEVEGQELTFEQGTAMAETGRVKEALQIGFHLSGKVEQDGSNATPGQSQLRQDASGTFHVAITFDRCKITSASCDCNSGEIFFCKHVVALAIFRIRKPHKVTIRSPISETLQQMDRDQLQKLTQYLLARHNRVLPAAQKVADSLFDPMSELNVIRGAPDPTAGAGLIDEDRWSLEDKKATRHVSNLLQNTNKQESALQLQSLLTKVREMLKARDSNGSRLLTLITNELMQHCSTHNHNQSTQSLLPPQPDICRIMWDQLGLLWVCVVLNPKISSQERQSFVVQLQEWGSQPHCPPESGEEEQNHYGQAPRSGRTVLSRAIDAGTMRWDDVHLRRILDDCKSSSESSRPKFQNDQTQEFHDDEGKPLWHEYVPTACARVEALRSHGCQKEAIALACAITRTIKRKFMSNFNTYKEHQTSKDTKTLDETLLPKLSQGLIGHPLRPVHILFDTLIGAKELCEQSIDTDSTKLAAFEITLLIMGQQRLMPEGQHSQDKMISSELSLINHLNNLELDDEMITVLKNVCQTLVEGGPTSGLGLPLHRESVPLHSFAKYLFQSILPYDRKLAFRVGIRAMKTPVYHRHEPNFYPDLHSHVVAPGHEHSAIGSTFPEQRAYHRPQPGTRWHIMDKLEANQCSLASILIQTAKGEVLLLGEVVESVQKYICNPTHIFQLSHDAYKAATPPLGSPDSLMLNVALQMGMQVLRMTIRGGTWRRTEMVGWLVTCATEIGLCALISIIRTWNTLFTPVEATTMVANCVVSPNTAMRLNLDPRQRDELFHCVCQMAIQCAVKDPQSCALPCLTLCENLPSAFDAAYHVVIDSSNKRRMDAAQLYNIARYLEQLGLRQRSFTVAFAATRCLTIAFNHDTHPATSDLLWTMQLAQSLGRNELTQMVSVVSRNVKCASVISDVLRTCTSGVNSRDTTNLAHFGERSLRADGPILRPLLEVAISAYVSTIHAKLSHISPRHYTEFIDFLNKARETFLLASNGPARFAHLTANLKMVYKGKKKLLNLVAHRFG
ncbi:zinc finger SWIM domain-containing protein 4-like [Styela clava]